MVDHFEKLGVHRRPWLDIDLIKQRFHDLSIEIHPDHSSDGSVNIKKENQKEFVNINLAFQCLSDTKLRVRHLLELESGRASENVQSVPSEMTDWFTAVGLVCKKVDLFLVKKDEQDSPMLQASLMEEGMLLNDEVSEMHQKLQFELNGINEELKILNKQWEPIMVKTLRLLNKKKYTCL